MSKSVLGIDVSKATLDVELMFGDKELKRKFENSQKGFRILQGWLMSLHIDHVHACLEATGRYGEAVAEFLYEKGHRVSVVNPLRIKRYAESDLKRNKTDQADAHTIAGFCSVKDPRQWHPMPRDIKQLQELTRRLGSLERMLASERNRLEIASATVRLSLRRIIRQLEKEIEEVKHLIKQHVDDHPDLKQQRKLLESVPGIGRKTAQMLLGELQFRHYTSSRAVAAEAGLSPRKDKSGTSIDRTRLSKVGNSRIRKALYMPAIVATKHNPVVREFAKRLARNGKAPMQIICAAMRKLLLIAFGVIKNNRPFDPNLACYI
jgi:transposase